MRARPRETHITMHDDTRVVGHYLVTPLTKITECGNYAASVSIRKGMHDRVFRFTPRFKSALAAMRYAMAEGRDMVRANRLV